MVISRKNIPIPCQRTIGTGDSSIALAHKTWVKKSNLRPTAIVYDKWHFDSLLKFRLQNPVDIGNVNIYFFLTSFTVAVVNLTFFSSIRFTEISVGWRKSWSWSKWALMSLASLKVMRHIWHLYTFSDITLVKYTNLSSNSTLILVFFDNFKCSKFWLAIAFAFAIIFALRKEAFLDLSLLKVEDLLWKQPKYKPGFSRKVLKNFDSIKTKTLH